MILKTIDLVVALEPCQCSYRKVDGMNNAQRLLVVAALLVIGVVLPFLMLNLIPMQGQPLLFSVRQVLSTATLGRQAAFSHHME